MAVEAETAFLRCVAKLLEMISEVLNALFGVELHDCFKVGRVGVNAHACPIAAIVRLDKPLRCAARRQGLSPAR